MKFFSNTASKSNEPAAARANSAGGGFRRPNRFAMVEKMESRQLMSSALLTIPGDPQGPAFAASLGTLSGHTYTLTEPGLADCAFLEKESACGKILTTVTLKVMNGAKPIETETFSNVYVSNVEIIPANKSSNGRVAEQVTFTFSTVKIANTTMTNPKAPAGR